MTKKTNKSFVSEIDKRLAEFDNTHPKTASQLAEIKKHDRVFKRRDTVVVDEQQADPLWD